jgi:hypothetical protein
VTRIARAASLRRQRPKYVEGFGRNLPARGTLFRNLQNLGTRMAPKRGHAAARARILRLSFRRAHVQLKQPEQPAALPLVVSCLG